LPDRGEQVGGRRRAERVVQSSELLDGDRARFEQPAEIARQIDDRRLEQDPAAGFGDVTKLSEDFGLDLRRWRVEERLEIGFR